MKKLTMAFLAAVLAVTCGVSFAAEQKQDDAANPAKRSVFQIGFFPGVPGSTKYYNVYGFKIGAPMVDGFNWVYGVEAAVLYSGTFHIKGCQATLAGPTIAIRVEGVQAATGPAFLKQLVGFQASPSPVILEYGYGCQAGAASIANRFKGFQTGAVTVRISLPEGCSWQMAEQQAGYEAPALLLTKDGETVGSLVLIGLGTTDRQALETVDTGADELPMPVFSPVALSNHAGYEDYQVRNAWATGAAATARYVWQDLSESEVLSASSTSVWALWRRKMPSSVSVTPLCPRSMRRTPSSSSSAAIWRESVGWVRLRIWDALVMFPVWAMVRK